MCDSEDVVEEEPIESGSQWISRLDLEAAVDPMVPPGFIEIRDGDGKLLLRRQWIGGGEKDA